MSRNVCLQPNLYILGFLNTFPAAPKIANSPPLREIDANLLRKELLKSKKALQEQLFISYTLNISQKSHDIYICHLGIVLGHHPQPSLSGTNRLNSEYEHF